MEQTARIDVAYIAKLAKLELTEEETSRFSEDLNQVLAYVEQLGQWDTTGVEPMYHPLPVYDALRECPPGVHHTPATGGTWARRRWCPTGQAALHMPVPG